MKNKTMILMRILRAIIKSYLSKYEKNIESKRVLEEIKRKKILVNNYIFKNNPCRDRQTSHTQLYSYSSAKEI